MATICYLCNIHHPKAINMLDTLYKATEESCNSDAKNPYKKVGLDFMLALKSAMDIMSSTDGQYHEAWKKALGDKLTETQALLEQKMEKLKRKQAKATRKPGFWDHQPPSSSGEDPSTSQSDCAL